MQAQYAFNAHRGAPRALGLGIDRLNRGHQVRPQYNEVHLDEKLLLVSGLAIPVKQHVCKGL